MSYRLKLNNKTFKAIAANNKYVTLLLKNKSDVAFFEKWYNRCKNGALKYTYVENIDFVKIPEIGSLMNCIPILNETHTEVKIYYDYKVVHYIIGTNNKKNIEITIKFRKKKHKKHKRCLKINIFLKKS